MEGERDPTPSWLGRTVRLVALLVLVAAFALIALSSVYLIHQISHRGPQILETPVILRQVQGLQELATVKYHVERVVAVTDPGMLGDERLVLVAHGIVRSGIDLSKLSQKDIEFDPVSSSVQVTLPPAKILDTYLDDGRTQVFLREKPFFRKLNKDLDQMARRDALMQITAAARELGIEKDAQQRAEAQVRAVLQAMGIKEVSVKFQP